MSAPGNTLEERKAALKRPGKKPGNNIYLIPVATAIAGLAAGAYFFAGKPVDDDQNGSVLPTTTSQEFQNANPGDGLFARTEAPKLKPGPSEAEIRLKQQLDELQNQIADLKANPLTVETENTEALDAMEKTLSELNDKISKQAQQLNDANIKAERLAAELEASDLLSGKQSAAALEAERLAEIERNRAEVAQQRREEARAIYEAQVHSPIIAFSSAGDTGGSVEDAKIKYRGDEAFVRSQRKAIGTTQSQVLANPANTVVRGTIVEGVLQTAISSDLQGDVLASVSYDVWSFDLSQILIPAGSKIYGRYSSDIGIGQKRILIAWDEIRTTDGQAVQIQAYGNDRLGRSGLTGQVDNHFAERFGSAALISIIGAAPTVIANNATDNENTTDVIESVGSDFNTAVGSITNDYLGIPRTIYVDQGATVSLTVNTDLELF